MRVSDAADFKQPVGAVGGRRRIHDELMNTNELFCALEKYVFYTHSSNVL